MKFVAALLDVIGTYSFQSSGLTYYTGIDVSLRSVCERASRSHIKECHGDRESECSRRRGNEPLAPKGAGTADAGNSSAGGLNTAGASLEDMASFRKSVSDCMQADGWFRW